MKLFTSLLFALAFLSCENDLAAKGIAALKKQHFHENENAKVFVFENLVVMPRHVRFTFENQPRPYLAKKLNPPIVEWVELLPQFHKEIKDDNAIAQYKKSLSECEAFTKKYPQTKKTLSAYMKVLNDDINQYDQGFLKVDEKWITNEQHELIQKENTASLMETRTKTTMNGRVYYDLKVTSITPHKISFIHRQGGNSVKLADLERDLQKKYNYDPIKEKEYLAQVKKARIEDLKKKKTAAEWEKKLQSAAEESLVVSQVLEDGLLARRMFQKKINRTYHTRKGALWFIDGFPDSDKIVDGRIIRGTFYYDGRHSYVTTEGSKATVPTMVYVRNGSVGKMWE